MKTAPMISVITNQRRSPWTSPRSAANTPIWHVTLESTRTVVKISEKPIRRWTGPSPLTPSNGGHSADGVTARTVKYIANSAAKNISSEDNQTIVPTDTIEGRVSEP